MCRIEASGSVFCGFGVMRRGKMCGVGYEARIWDVAVRVWCGGGMERRDVGGCYGLLEAGCLVSDDPSATCTILTIGGQDPLSVRRY